MLQVTVVRSGTNSELFRYTTTAEACDMVHQFVIDAIDLYEKKKINTQVNIYVGQGFNNQLSLPKRPKSAKKTVPLDDRMVTAIIERALRMLNHQQIKKVELSQNSGKLEVFIVDLADQEHVITTRKA